MARAGERMWTRESLATVYQQRAPAALAERLIEVLERVQGLGRLFPARAINPAFGIASNSGRRAFSIREHHGNAILGNITLFPAPERFATPREYDALRDRLLPIAKPDAAERSTSWDVASIAELSDAAFRRFLDVLDWLGPAPASDATVDVPARIDTITSRIVRDSAIVRRLKRLYDDRCQICGERVSGLHGWTYAEAHHVRPLGAPHGGPDAEDNLLILCPNHHAACDFGAIELKSTELRFEPGHVVRPEHLRYHNERIVRRPD